MPVIKKIEKQPRKPRTNEYNDAKLLRRQFYNSSKWQKLRKTFFVEHPLCDECLKKGIIKAGESVHHLKSPFKDGKINWEVGLDYDNLRTLCAVCHEEEHNRLKNDKYMTPEEIIAQLDALFDDNIPDKAFENDNK